MWPSTGRARRGGDAGSGTEQPDQCWEGNERLNCALRAYLGRAEAAGSREGPAQGQFGNTLLRKEKTPTEFFTESLILAQNERWRRV